MGDRPRGTGVSVTRRSPKPQRQVRFLGPPLARSGGWASPGFRRPVAVVQGDSVNASRIATTVVVPLTRNARLAAAPGNVLLTAARDLQLVLSGIDLVLGRE